MSLTMQHVHFKAMGSPCDLQFYCENTRQAGTISEQVIADIHRIEAKYSRYREDSFLSQINRVATEGGSIAIDQETAALFAYADTCYQQSHGLFDITSGILRKAWDFKSEKTPAKSTIKKLLKRIGWNKVQFSQTSVSFKVPGMQLDFGGIGKEYAVDRAAVLCLERGVNHGMINLGGDIKIIGPHPDGKPWIVGIQHPREKDAMLTKVEVYSGAVASSGDYERCIIINGKRYGHVLNPKTGWPVSGLAAITVLADQCVIAGSACTIAMLQERRGKKWIKDLGLYHVWMDQQGRIGGNWPVDNIALS